MRRALLVLFCSLPLAAQTRNPFSLGHVDLSSINVNVPKESTILKELQAKMCKNFPDTDECACRKERYKKQCIADRQAARAQASAALKAKLAAGGAKTRRPAIRTAARPAVTQAPIEPAAPAPPRNTVRIVGLDEGTRETPLQR
jgi:hypothetical protein